MVSDFKNLYYPHERGWSRMYLKSQIDKIVLPARAGVILRNVEFKAWDSGTTRTSGGDPKRTDERLLFITYYPHERGWSCGLTNPLRPWKVLPARAGVILWARVSSISSICTTRTSGGDPYKRNRLLSIKWYYPHERGWSCRVLKNKVASMVLPARAGVILQANEIQKNFKVLPVLFRLLLKIYF